MCVDALGLLPALRFGEIPARGPAAKAIVGKQRISLASGVVEAPVYDRAQLGSGAELKVPGEDKPIDVTIVREPVRVPGARIEVRVEDGKLLVTAAVRWDVLDFEKGKPVPLIATSDTEFYEEGDDHTRLAFVRDAEGKVTGVVLNPGPSEIRAAKL